jgi:hypothetical protein
MSGEYSKIHYPLPKEYIKLIEKWW